MAGSGLRVANETFTCRHCGWSGPGSLLDVGHVGDDATSMDCPKCGRFVAAEPHETLEAANARAATMTASERSQLDWRKRRQDCFPALDESFASTLPDLGPGPFSILWDFEENTDPDDLGPWTIVRHEDRVLWREPAYYEGFERFTEVARFLARRYGTALVDLAPVGSSELYLLGDSLGAGGQVAATRGKLAMGKLA